MKRTRVCIVGFGRLGRACAEAVGECAELELAGVVRRPGSPQAPHARLAQARIVAHVRDLERVEVALLCVPASDSEARARELIQQGFAVVECAQIEADRRAAYHDALADFALRHRARAMLGAGWDPGVLTLVRGAFEMLIPRGHTQFTRRPAASMHHTAAAEGVEGVRGALAVEYPGPDGSLQRYVYVELEKPAHQQRVSAAIAADPAFAGETTQVFVVDSIAALEEEAHGMLLERRGSAPSGAHETMLLEGRGDPAELAARAMVDAARRLPSLKVGGHRYFLAV